jgi:hypothetical protein
VLASQPIAYWPLRETTGPIAHDVLGRDNWTIDGGQTPLSSEQSSHPLAVRPADDPSKPLITVDIRGGFTGAQMVASVYRDGRVVTVRHAGRSSTRVETRVPLSHGAVQTVLAAAVRSHVFAIPRSVQDAVFGADYMRSSGRGQTDDYFTQKRLSRLAGAASDTARY